MKQCACMACVVTHGYAWSCMGAMSAQGSLLLQGSIGKLGASAHSGCTHWLSDAWPDLELSLGVSAC